MTECPQQIIETLKIENEEVVFWVDEGSVFWVDTGVVFWVSDD